MTDEHGDLCACFDCEDERAAYRGPDPWELLREAALGFAHELPEVVQELVLDCDVHELMEAAHDAYTALLGEGKPAAAAAVLEEVEAQC